MSNEVESRQPGVGGRKVRTGTRKRPVIVAAAVDAAPAEQTVPASESPATIDTGIDETTIGSIEAVLLSVDRPVSAVSLAEALGLLGDSEVEIAQAEDNGEPAIVARAKGRAKGKGGGSGGEAVSPMQIVRRAIESLNQQYEQTGRAFRIETVAGGYRVMTLPRFAAVIEQFAGKRERTSLSRAAVETLAIVAYKQPMTRAQLEAIRGVACGEVLRTLMERRLVTITGRAEELGRPMLYGTTRQFLEAFGLSTLKDLPSAAEFKARHVGGE